MGELRAAGVSGVVTTNAPGGSWDKALDHNDVFQLMDMASFDNYPVNDKPRSRCVKAAGQDPNCVR